MGVHIGYVTTWDTGCTVTEQVRKIAEEQHEVTEAAVTLECDFQEGYNCRHQLARLREECADLITATANLLAILRVDDFTEDMERCAERQRERGRL